MPIETPHERTILSRRTRLALAFAAVAAAVLLAVPAAQAATFCVGAPSNCSGTQLPGDGDGLYEALSQAQSNAESDTVRVGAGTYTSPEPGAWQFSDSVHGIEIRGEGPTETVLRGIGLGAPTLKLTGANEFISGVENLGLRLSAGGGDSIGLDMVDGRAENVAVTVPSGLTAGRGVRLGGNSVFTGGRVITPGLVAIETTGLAVIERSSIAADVGVESTSGTLGLAQSNIDTSRIGVLSSAAMYLLDSVIHVTGGAATEYGVLGTADVAAVHLTVVGTAGPSYGIRAYRPGGGTAVQHVDNSTVTGFDDDLSAGAGPLGLASIAVSHSNYSTTSVEPGGAINPGYGNVDVAPGFADPASGNFHLRHDSPLVDAAHDLALDGDRDLDDLPRVVDGDADGDARPDIGASEYQRAAPLAAISGPDAATVGQAMDFSAASSSDPDPADALTYKWWFGDGTTASGATASHAYATAGTHAVTLEVTDPTGQQRTVTKSILVVAAAAGGSTGAGATTPAPTDALAPVISRLRAARAGKAIRFRLSEPARVTLKLRPVGTGGVAKRIRLNGRSGANLVRLRGRLAKTLRPGRYRVTASARDAAGNRSRPRVARLVLLRRAG